MISFGLPAYQRAMGEFMRAVVHGIADLDPLLSQIRRQPTIHAGPIRNVAGPDPVDQTMVTLQQQVSVPEAVIRNSQLDEFGSLLCELAADFTSDLATFVTQGLTAVIAASGNEIDAAGAPLSWDLVLDAIERVDIDFDADGRAILPSIMLHPRTAELLYRTERTSEQDQRFAEILAAKKRDHDAQKRTRQLPR